MLAAALRSLTTAERALPVAVAAIVAIASLLAILPSTPLGGAVGGTQGRGTDARIAVGGGVNLSGASDIEGGTDIQGGTDIEGGTGAVSGAGTPSSDLSFQPVRLPDDIAIETPAPSAAAAEGPFLDDGTLLTGYAPATAVQDGSDLIEIYKVKSGDTLVTIAREFGVSMMTLWWANKLTSKDSLRIGQQLKIPSVNGVVVTVKETDTLQSLAAKYSVTEARVIELNALDDPTLVVGQVLVLPDAKGAPIPTPKPTPKPAVRPRVSGGGSPRTTPSQPSTGGPSHYSGGSFHWPVVGGGNYISQYFHYGHYGVDIAADFGSPVVAAAGGKVIFSGWKSNGGGWQVWISHGDGLYTTYNHMSGLSVGNGESVGKGEQVGRIGQSGHATGPHLHFEVWHGTIWDAGTRVNPLRYF
jgi:murein DD-endopeptidase MepM/ murein hydrolase activator NlpD